MDVLSACRCRSASAGDQGTRSEVYARAERYLGISLPNFCVRSPHRIVDGMRVFRSLSVRNASIHFLHAGGRLARGSPVCGGGTREVWPIRNPIWVHPAGT